MIRISVRVLQLREFSHEKACLRHVFFNVAIRNLGNGVNCEIIKFAGILSYSGYLTGGPAAENY